MIATFIYETVECLSSINKRIFTANILYLEKYRTNAFKSDGYIRVLRDALVKIPHDIVPKFEAYFLGT